MGSNHLSLSAPEEHRASHPKDEAGSRCPASVVLRATDGIPNRRVPVKRNLRMVECSLKTCSKCGAEKGVGEFASCPSTKDRLRPECRSCQKTYRRAHYVAHREEYIAAQMRYQRSHISCALRIRLALAVRSHKGIGKRSGSAVRDLGCTIPELKRYLEAKFRFGMTWENWSRAGWHIDHIKPLASFDLTDRCQLLQACHYTNLQPLWASENLSKGDRVL